MKCCSENSCFIPIICPDQPSSSLEKSTNHYILSSDHHILPCQLTSNENALPQTKQSSLEEEKEEDSEAGSEEKEDKVCEITLNTATKVKRTLTRKLSTMF